MDVEFLKYRYDDPHDGVIIKNKWRPGVRHVQAVYMVACAAALGVVRSAAPLAVLAASDVSSRNHSYIQMQSWDRRVQGQIVSSFLLGHALMLLPAELCVTRMGGKLALSVALVVNGVLTVAMPTIANRAGWLAVYNAYLWLGMTQASVSPAMRALLARWMPPNERTVCSAIIHSGVSAGVVLGLPLSGVVSEARLGWELVFYSLAMLTLSMAVIWVLLTSGTPDQHQAVGDKEKEYIREALSCYHKKKLQVPWRRILTSKQFWGGACAHAAAGAVFVFCLVDAPAYLTSFGMSLRESSCRAVLPLAAFWAWHAASAPVAGRAARLLCLAFRMRLTHFRKLLNALGAAGVVSGLVVLASLRGNQPTLALLVLTATLAALGFQLSGFFESYSDLSENFSGHLVALSGAVAALAGALVPFATGLAVGQHVLDVDRWHVVLASLAGAHAAGTLVYSVLGSSERAAWDVVGAPPHARVDDTKFGYHNRTIDTNLLELEELSGPAAGRHKHDEHSSWQP